MNYFDNYKTKLFDKYLINFCQSGVISPNLVTLILSLSNSGVGIPKTNTPKKEQFKLQLIVLLFSSSSCSWIKTQQTSQRRPFNRTDFQYLIPPFLWPILYTFYERK